MPWLEIYVGRKIRSKKERKKKIKTVKYSIWHFADRQLCSPESRNKFILPSLPKVLVRIQYWQLGRYDFGCFKTFLNRILQFQWLETNDSVEFFMLSRWRQRRQWHPTPVLLPGKSHGQRSLVGCSPWGREESDRTEWLHFHFSLSCIGEGNGNPLQCSCLENPRDGRAWWAAIYGVAQSQTWLKWLSSSSSSRWRSLPIHSVLPKCS